MDPLPGQMHFRLWNLCLNKTKSTCPKHVAQQILKHFYSWFLRSSFFKDLINFPLLCSLITPPYEGSISFVQIWISFSQNHLWKVCWAALLEKINMWQKLTTEEGRQRDRWLTPSDTYSKLTWPFALSINKLFNC